MPWRSITHVVVVIGLVVTIGSSIAAVVLKVRLVAGKMACGPNERQIAIAIHNYHNDYECFPPPTLPNPRLPIERRLSWYAVIWPYFEATWLRLDKDRAWDDKAIITPKLFGMDAKDPGMEQRGPMHCWICPRNPNLGDPNGLSFTHYVGITGIGTDSADLELDDVRAGFFGYSRKLSIKYVQAHDGVSNTLLLAETTWDNGPWLAGGRPTIRCLDPDGPTYVGMGGQFGCNGLHARRPTPIAPCASWRPTWIAKYWKRWLRLRDASQSKTKASFRQVCLLQRHAILLWRINVAQRNQRGIHFCQLFG